MDKGISIRLIVDDDIPFVLATWLRSYKHGSSFAKRITYPIFYYQHEPIAKKLIGRSTTIIAHLADDPEIILGYMVFELNKHGERPIIHYLFTKKDWRNMGIARKLLKESGLNIDQCQFSHWTYPIDDYFSKHQSMIYNPYKIG